MTSLWSDYEIKPCRQCGEVMSHAKGAPKCRACQMGQCADSSCRKHGKSAA